MLQEDSREPIEQNEPTLATDRQEAAEPMLSTEPLDPTLSTEPTEPMESTEPAEPRESTESVEATPRDVMLRG
jgi:hypothetical protein